MINEFPRIPETLLNMMVGVLTFGTGGEFFKCSNKLR